MSLFVAYRPIALGGSSGGGVTTMGAFGSSPNANGGTITGATLTLQPADGTHPGGVSITTQTFGGNKTFLGTISASNLSGTNTGDVTIGTANGLSLAGQILSLALSSTSTTGALSSTDWNTFNNKQSALTFGNLTDAGTDGITVTGGTGAVIGSGTSLSQHVADTTHNGYLSSTDWNTFNGKQAAGNYITALTGDVTASGPGSAAATVAKIQGTTVSGTTGSGNVVFSASPTLTGTITAAAATFSGIINANGGIDRSSAGTLSIGATNSTIINIGNSGATVNIQGTTIYENTPQLLTSDPLITVNHGGGAGSGQNAGVQVEENAIITGYAETSADRNSWILKAPNTAGIATITPGAGGITLDQSSHNPVTIGTANGLSLSTQVLSLALSSTSTTGALSNTDWNTFNGKQAAGSYITALTGDVTASGPGSAAATVAKIQGTTVSGTTGTTNVVFSNSPTLVTPALGTPSAIVLTSGTGLPLTTGVTGTLPIANGGTNATTKAAAFDSLSPMTTGGDIIYGGASGTGTRLANGTAGQFLKSNGTTTAPSWANVTATYTAPTVQRFTTGTSQTYTKPANVLYIRVRMIGPGGGGAGSGTANGTAATDGTVATTFTDGTLTLTAGVGVAGTRGGNGGTGGAATISSGTGIIQPGEAGDSIVTTVNSPGGRGGRSVFAGAGQVANAGAAQTAATANSGSGGSGGGGTATAIAGAGGGSGGYVEFLVSPVSATYTYTVGQGGTAGGAGTSGFAGSAGAAGQIYVEEFYQ